MDCEVNQKLYSKALKLLSYKPYSEAELRGKLSKYAEEKDVDTVIEKLKALNLINDLNLSYNFASYRVRTKFFGRVRAAKDLQKRLVSQTIARQALDSVFQEVDEAEIIDKAIEKWIKKAGAPKSINELKRLHNYLERQGFPYGLIYDKLEAYHAEIGQKAYGD